MVTSIPSLDLPKALFISKYRIHINNQLFLLQLTVASVVWAAVFVAAVVWTAVSLAAVVWAAVFLTAVVWTAVFLAAVGLTAVDGSFSCPSCSFLIAAVVWTAEVLAAIAGGCKAAWPWLRLAEWNCNGETVQRSWGHWTRCVGHSLAKSSSSCRSGNPRQILLPHPPGAARQLWSSCGKVVWRRMLPETNSRLIPVKKDLRRSSHCFGWCLTSEIVRRESILPRSGLRTVVDRRSKVTMFQS